MAEHHTCIRRESQFGRHSILTLIGAIHLVISVAALGKPSAKPDCAKDVDACIDAMSADERIAQLLIVGFDGPSMNADLSEQIARQHVGGVVLYAGNLHSPQQIKRLTASIRDAAGRVPPFIAVDQEGGFVYRVKNGVPVLPSSMAIGATRSPELSRRAGFAVARALRELGFDMNLAPVLDVLPPGHAAAIDIRAFGDDPDLVASLGAAFIEGEIAAGIIPVGKHFPGQGAAAEDTHMFEVTIASTRDALFARDLVPYRRAFGAGLRAVMTAHVALPNVTNAKTLPATLSPAVMTGILRRDLKFDGVAITDALQMKAASIRPPGDVALEALRAGCDMILALGGPKQRQLVFDRLRGAYRTGELTDARVRESLRRILKLKAQPIPLSPAASKGDDRIEDEIARRAVTIAGNPELLASFPKERVVYAGPAGPLEHDAPAATSIILPEKFEPAESLAKKRALLAALKSAAGWIAAAQNEAQWTLISEVRAARPDLPLIFVNLSTPYRIVTSTNAFTLLTYSATLASQSAAAAVIDRRAIANGTAPVQLRLAE